jgi:hypothetical protein
MTRCQKGSQFYGNGVRSKAPELRPILTNSGFLMVTDLNDFNGPTQTTNLSVGRSNRSRCAIQASENSISL